MRRPLRTTFPAILLLMAATLAAGPASPSPEAARWFPLASGSPGDTAVLSLATRDDHGLRARVQVPGLTVREVPTSHGPRGRLDIPGGGVTAERGRPRLPVVRRLIEVPPGAQVVLAITPQDPRTVSLADLGLEVPVLPVQPPVPKMPGAEKTIPYLEESATYTADQLFPAGRGRLASRGIVRGRHVVLVELFPVRYNPVRETLEVWSRAEIALRFHDARPAAARRNKGRLRSFVWDPWLDEALGAPPPPSEELSLAGSGGGPAEGAEGLLVVAHDDFLAALEPLLDWKERSGFKVETIRTSDLGASPTDDDVKAAIQARYDSWSNPSLGFVLLAGDTDFTPIHIGHGGGNTQVTDNWYACLDGTDYLPDVAIARVSTRTAQETADVVDKLLTYERALFADGAWVKQAGFIGTSDSGHISLIEGTHDWCIDTYYTTNAYQPTTWSHGKESCDRHYHTYDADTSEIAASIDEGRSMVNYSGHGGYTSWEGPTSHGSYDQDDIRGNTNDGMYPFIVSNACITGTLDQTECFGETWQKEASKGAIAFWGASNNSYWDEDDVLQRDLHGNIFPMDETPPIGILVNETKVDLYNYYGDVSNVAYYFDMYNLLSEPSLSLWTRAPRDGQVSFPDSLPIGESSFTVTVTFGGQPVEGALAAVRREDDGVFEAGYTDASGQITLTLDPAPASVGPLEVTVTKHDFRPHEGTSQVIAPDSPWLVHRSHRVDDAAGGDGDGQASPGETFIMPVTVENVGEQAGTGLQGTLVTSTPAWAEVLDDDAAFPDLAPHQQGESLPRPLPDPGHRPGAGRGPPGLRPQLERRRRSLGHHLVQRAGDRRGPRPGPGGHRR